MVSAALTIGIIGFIIILGVVLSRLSDRFKFPHILVLILFGILIGPVLKWFDPIENQTLIHAIVTFALIIVLFDAGYEIKMGRLKKELVSSMRLTLPAMFLSVIVAMAFSMLVFDFTWQMALLLGVIIASTDITIVAPMLKVFEIKPQIKDTLNIEATLNSVLAIIIATVITGFAVGAKDALYTATQTFLYQVFVGVGLGVVFGYMLVFVIKHLKSAEQMPEVLSIGAILLIYAVAQFIGASGIFAVFVAGIIFGNAPYLNMKKIIAGFQTNIAFLIVVFVYVILGAMLNLNVFLSAGIAGIIFALLIVLSRAPAAFSYRFKWAAEDQFFFLVGPKGMTCVVLALFFATKFPDSDLVLGLVFITILISVVIASVSHKLVKTKELKAPKIRAKTVKKKVRRRRK